MSNTRERYKHTHLGTLIFVLAFASIVGSQQQADLTFDASVSNPAYTATHPKAFERLGGKLFFVRRDAVPVITD